MIARRHSPIRAFVALIAVATAAAALAASPALAQNAAPGPLLSKRVREAIAERWGVEPGIIHLEWGAVRDGIAPAEDAGFELIGNGVGGNWVVAFAPGTPGGPSHRVWLRAGVELLEPVAARELGRDHELGLDDIASAAVVRWGGPGPAEEVDLVGWITRRQVRAGEPLREPAVGPPLAIRSGERVQAVWRRPGIALTLEARALGTAVVGGKVFVRTDTGLRLEGTASARGVVEIDAPMEVRS